MNLHTLPRTFYLTRHGQSEYNLLGKIGGDSGLTAAGVEYAKRLATFAQEHIGRDPNNDGKERPCRLWTSTLRRTKETTQYIEHNSFDHTWDNGETAEWVNFRRMPRRNLDELYAGICDGMTYKEIEQVYPEEFARRQSDKLAYRYPRGTYIRNTQVLVSLSKTKPHSCEEGLDPSFVSHLTRFVLTIVFSLQLYHDMTYIYYYN
jgi:broad specificity phosphatase PhoE